MMEVILLERVPNLGQMGDVVRVRPGFARNFLLPQKKAMRATAENRRFFDSRRADLEARNIERKKEAEAAAQKVAGTTVVLLRQAGDSGQLYGSVTSRDVAEALAATGVMVDRQQVEIERPIKSLGLFEVHIALHPEVREAITVNVARSAEEAEMQQKRGGMISRDDIEAEEEEEAERLAADLASLGLTEEESAALGDDTENK